MSQFDTHLSALKALYNKATEAIPGSVQPSAEFSEFKKIPRLNRDIIITEKIDGTNAQIFIDELPGTPGERDGDAICVTGGFRLRAGQRTRWATPERDNAGFAKWAFANAEELVNLLGIGRHFGEWWGAGVQRTYGLKEKRFSLFNVSRYGQVTEYLDPRCVSKPPSGVSYGPTIGLMEWYQTPPPEAIKHQTLKGEKVCACRDARPATLTTIGGVQIEAVPVLYRGPWFTDVMVWAPGLMLNEMRTGGSLAVPGYMDPEGIVVFHEASGTLFKATCKDDEKPKGAR